MLSDIWDKKAMMPEEIQTASDPLEKQVDGGVASREWGEDRQEKVASAYV